MNFLEGNKLCIYLILDYGKEIFKDISFFDRDIRGTICLYNELIIESSSKWNFPKKLFKKIGKTTIVITIFVE